MTKVGISHWTTHDQDGYQVETPNFPFKFSFEAADVNFPEEAPANLDVFLSQFTTLRAGTKLYTVKTHSGPVDHEGTELGSLVTTKKCVTSRFGDTKLFFRHRPISEDEALKPEWGEAYQNDCGQCP